MTKWKDIEFHWIWDVVEILVLLIATAIVAGFMWLFLAATPVQMSAECEAQRAEMENSQEPKK